jgi:PAS domain S-box-containing protein
MKNNIQKSRQLKALRNKAQSIKEKHTKNKLFDMPFHDIKSLIHELEVHQIELEMQNEELLAAQNQLEDSRSKYSDLYDFAPVGYFTISEKGMIREVNFTGARQLATDRSLLMKKPFTHFIHRDDADAYYLHHREVMKSKDRRACEVRMVRKDKTEFYAQLVSAAMKDSSGRTLIRSALMNITVRKNAEKELIRHREHLVELVEERTCQLRKVNERLEKEITERKRVEAESIRTSHLVALGELAAGVAHEINNPINGIINYAQMLANKSPQESREQDIAGRLIKEGDRIAVIVNNLLSFARNSNDAKSPVNIRDIISVSIALTQAQIRNDGIDLKLSISRGIPHIVAQPQQIEQVFLNIISNARYALNEKYPGTDKKKILTVSARKATIKKVPHVQIVVHDTGHGIRAGLLDKVLNPFFTTKPSGVGTGLGLSISHGIISDHGGSVRIESKEGEFTKVIIVLPVHRPINK